MENRYRRRKRKKVKIVSRKKFFSRIVLILILIFIICVQAKKNISNNMKVLTERQKSKQTLKTDTKLDLTEVLKSSKQNHSKKNFTEASKGYQLIIESKNSSKNLKLEAQAYLALSSNNISLDSVQHCNVNYIKESTVANNEYKNKKYSYKNLSNYEATGDYMEAGKSDIYYTHEDILIDNLGLPKVKYNNGYHYNPVTMAQFILTNHSKFITQEDSNAKKLMITGSNALIHMQTSNGSFPLQFRYKHYLNTSPFQTGWVSSLAQGQAISALTRAYSVTGDEKYLEAANKSFEFMKKKIRDGGTLDTTDSLNSALGLKQENSLFYQEYITNPPSYTLNGFIYTMIGLYDLSQTEDSVYNDEAKIYFDNCDTSLHNYLKYYDLGNFTAYDLNHIINKKQPTINIDYHSCHIELMSTMYNLTQNPIYDYYQNMWKSYVN